MKKVASFLRNKTVLLTTVVILAGGGTVAAIAVATIPDSSGIIHGCYQKDEGDLRVVKKDSDCKKSEKSLNWAQFGAPQHGIVAYAHVLSNGTLDTANSFNVNSSSASTVDPARYCLNVGGSFKTASVTPSDQSVNTGNIVLSGVTTNGTAIINIYCAAGAANALVSGTAGTEFFATFLN